MRPVATGSEWSLAPGAGGGWTLETGDDATAIAVRRRDGGWHAVGPRQLPSTIVACDPAGFTALDAGGAERARSSAPRGMETDTRLRHLLLADGRLFRIVRSGASGGGFDLLGWETPGSYLEARREDGGWTIRRTPAGRALGEPAVATLLFCMEIVDAGEAGARRTEDT